MIGRHGQLPWKLATDLARFRSVTIGKPVIMGRKTFQSLGKPLPGRDNIVITHDATFAADGAIVASSVDDALAKARACATARQVDWIMVIGGAEIFRTMLAQADRVYFTRVHAQPEGDTVLDDLDLARWVQVELEEWRAGPRDDFAATYLVYDRIGATP